jgi:hypothetical protein
MLCSTREHVSKRPVATVIVPPASIASRAFAMTLMSAVSRWIRVDLDLGKPAAEIELQFGVGSDGRFKQFGDRRDQSGELGSSRLEAAALREGSS